MPPAVLRTLPFGTAVLLLRQTKPAVIDLTPWPSRPDARELVAGQKAVEKATAAAAVGHTPRAPAAADLQVPGLTNLGDSSWAN